MWTNSALTLTTKQPSNAPNCIDSFIKCSDEPHNTNEQQFHSMCSKCPPPACIHDLRWSRHWSVATSMTFFPKPTQQRSNINLMRCVKFTPSRVSFITKSNSENFIKIRWFFMKLHIKMSWLHFLWLTVYMLHQCAVTLLQILVSHPTSLVIPANNTSFCQMSHVRHYLHALLPKQRQYRIPSRAVDTNIYCHTLKQFS